MSHYFQTYISVDLWSLWVLGTTLTSLIFFFFLPFWSQFYIIILIISGSNFRKWLHGQQRRRREIKWFILGVQNVFRCCNLTVFSFHIINYSFIIFSIHIFANIIIIMSVIYRFLFMYHLFYLFVYFIIIKLPKPPFNK